MAPATAVTTHAQPHAQQQLSRDLEVERAAMGQSCRPQSFGEVHQRNPQPCRAGFLVNCSEFKDGLSVYMTTKTFFTFRVIFSYPYSSTSMSRGHRRVVPAAAVTTHAKPHAQKQPSRDLEVERTAMGQRCRPQSFGGV